MIELSAKQAYEAGVKNGLLCRKQFAEDGDTKPNRSEWLNALPIGVHPDDEDEFVQGCEYGFKQ